MDLDALVADFLAHRRGRRVKPASLALYQRMLAGWLAWRRDQNLLGDVADVRIQDFRSYLLYLTEERVPHVDNPRRPTVDQRKGLAPSSVDTSYRTLRAFWRYLAMEGLLSPEQALFFTNGRIPRPFVPDAVRPHYDASLVELLLDACQLDRSDEEEMRNRAAILMLCESGMRISEVCGLTDQQVDMAGRQAWIEGKGSQMRWVFWGPRTAHALRQYLRFRRGAKGGPLFRGVASRNQGGPITPDTMRGVVRKLSKRAEIELPEGAPVHGFRHFFARYVLDKGVDGLHLQQLLGHKSSKTTERYVREHPTRLRRVHARLFEETRVFADEP